MISKTFSSMLPRPLPYGLRWREEENILYEEAPNLLRKQTQYQLSKMILYTGN